MTKSASASGNLGDIVKTDGAGYLDQRDGAHHTPAQIDLSAARLAAGAIAHGFRRGDRVAILAENGAPFTVAYLGLMRAGLVPVPVSYRLTPDTIAYIVRDCGAVAVLHDAARAAMVPDGVAAIDIGSGVDALLAERPTAPISPQPGEIAEILYTSGSTGRPKGVPLSHDGQLWALDRFLGVSSHAAERTVISAPAYHMNGLFFTTVALALGYFAVSMPRFDARAYLEAAAEHRCTILSGIPTMFALMARERDLLARLDFTSVKDIVIGSAPLTQALIDRVKAIFPQAAIRNSYGTTETGPAMFGPHPQGLARPPLALGYPYPDVELRLVGGLSADEGLLETRTPATLSAYLNLPGVSAERLKDGWYSTGDVLRRDAQGFFHFVGRGDDMFVCGGENVYPGEVEKMLERHPAVLEAAVVATEDEIKGAIPVAFIVRAPGATVEADELKQFALANGPAYSHPRAFAFLDRMPVNGAHKIDRSVLKPLAAQIVTALGR
ncbi:MAG TPA: class I adenylate-forming enzyme family protein [Rhizomicrobium sp.]